MKQLLLVAVLAATLTLPACNKSKAPVVNTDPNSANFTASAKPVVLPPAVKSSKSYRCADDSVVKVNLFQGDKMASVAEETGAPTMLNGTEAGKPLIAPGYELTVAGDTLTLERPAHPKQKCVG